MDDETERLLRALKAELARGERILIVGRTSPKINGKFFQGVFAGIVWFGLWITVGLMKGLNSIDVTAWLLFTIVPPLVCFAVFPFLAFSDYIKRYRQVILFALTDSRLLKASDGSVIQVAARSAVKRFESNKKRMVIEVENQPTINMALIAESTPLINPRQ